MLLLHLIDAVYLLSKDAVLPHPIIIRNIRIITLSVFDI